MNKSQITRLKNRPNFYIEMLEILVIKINYRITHLSVFKSKLIGFNFILPADNTC